MSSERYGGQAASLALWQNALMLAIQRNDLSLLAAFEGLAEEGLAIYQNNYQGILCRALESVYPVCCEVVGRDYFRRLCRALIVDCPAQQGDLNMYGAVFADWLQQQPAQRHLREQLPYVVELVELEWLFHAVYYLADSPCLDPQTLTALAPEAWSDVRLYLAGDVQVRHYQFPVFEIWSSHRAGRPALSLAALEAGQYCVVYRDQGVPQIDCIECDLARLMLAIDQGQSLQCLQHMVSAQRLQDLFMTLIARQWLGGFMQGGQREALECAAGGAATDG